MADGSCKIQMDGGILDIGTRYAIYGTAALTMGLGALAIFSVKQSLVDMSEVDTDSTLTLEQKEKKRDDEMYENIRHHKRSVRPVATTLNLTGIAMVGAAFILQSQPIQSKVEEQQNDPQSTRDNSQGPFTLFHAYTLLSLLWLITLTGLMVHVHTWVFNVIRRQTQGALNRSPRRFLNSIWNGTHWYFIQVEVLGIYGYYVCTHREAFPPPPCPISVFDDDKFRLFAKVIYIIAMIPIVNVGLLCVVLVGSVWFISLCATHLGSHYSRGKAISPLVFHFFWFLCCGTIAMILGVTTEVLLFTNTNSQNMWTFGSLLAFILLLVPAETFILELYSVVAPENVRYKMKTNLGTHREDSSDRLLDSRYNSFSSLPSVEH
ncbi:hypothetical protein RhiJN_14811 [Ceratobasidium sp. AG-Ba]|nr:hypothetical protein RhiJN_14811 [Ceratobasidium sp. AG-Ba]QRW15348.1 hypothetical protein RhiLY_14347 [Ceratobasidium sp. AG-Ba]